MDPAASPSDTPRTDAELGRTTVSEWLDRGPQVSADFARGLEREISSLTLQNAIAIADLHDCQLKLDAAKSFLSAFNEPADASSL